MKKGFNKIMKKIFALVLSIVMILSCSVTAFAYEDTYAGSGELEITGHIYSHYNITIPATINIKDTPICEVTVNDGYIEEGYSLDVFVTNLNDSGFLSLKHVTDQYASAECSVLRYEGDSTVNVTTPNEPIVSFTASDFPSGTSCVKYFGLEMSQWGTPGDYTGTMKYSFSCNPIE